MKVSKRVDRRVDLARVIVERDDGRDGGEQTDGRRDQRLGDARRHLRQGRLAARSPTRETHS